jgi:hypothetical protein
MLGMRCLWLVAALVGSCAHTQDGSGAGEQPAVGGHTHQQVPTESPSGVPVKSVATAPRTLGSLDPDIIRSIVGGHAGRIKSCYEQELTRTPDMTGKVIMKWVINGQGQVTQALVVATQLNNAAVESCLANEILTWTFPKPTGGGTVIVNYPFVFKRSDG